MAKADAAFRTIGEVATALDLPQHVLRFWESRFPQIAPQKSGGGRRYYRPNDIALLRAIHRLLHVEGYTIRGVQRLLRSQGVAALRAGLPPGTDESAEPPLQNAPDDTAPSLPGHPDDTLAPVAAANDEIRALVHLLDECCHMLAAARSKAEAR